MDGSVNQDARRDEWKQGQGGRVGTRGGGGFGAKFRSGSAAMGEETVEEVFYA